MNKKVALLGCGILLAMPLWGDVVHLAGGGRLSAEVTGFADEAFQLKTAGGIATNVSAASVRAVDFEHGHVTAKVETKSHGTVTGKLWLLDRQRFNMEDSTGTTRYIPFGNVVRAMFSYVAEPAKQRPVVRPATVPVPESPKRATSDPDIAVISHGERVNIVGSLAHGKITVVDFYAAWCGPCRIVAPILEAIAREDSEVAIRKVDIVRWNSDVTVQYKITSIPRLEIYDADSTLVRTFHGSNEKELRETIERAKASLSR